MFKVKFGNDFSNVWDNFLCLNISELQVLTFPLQLANCIESRQ